MQAGAARGVPGSEIRASCDAFEYVQLLRLREQHRRGVEGGGVANANIVPLDDAAGSRPPDPEGGDAADAQDCSSVSKLDYPG